MTERNYYRLALTAPPVVHGLLAAVPNPLQVWAALSITSVGIPYLIWAIMMLVVIRKSSLASLRRWVLLAPVTCLGVFTVCFIVYWGYWSVLMRPGDAGTLPSVLARGVVEASRELLAVFVIYILGIGYLWTGMALVGRRLISSQGES